MAQEWRPHGNFHWALKIRAHKEGTLKAKTQRMKSIRKLQLELVSLLLQQQTTKQKHKRKETHAEGRGTKEKKNNLPCLSELFPLFTNNNEKP